MTSFLKIAQQFFMCEYFLLTPIDVPSFELIEGQIKELPKMAGQDRVNTLRVLHKITEL